MSIFAISYLNFRKRERLEKNVSAYGWSTLHGSEEDAWIYLQFNKNWVSYFTVREMKTSRDINVPECSTFLYRRFIPIVHQISVRASGASPISYNINS